jgi:uncharacterized repeat protein (TIGR03803 family)
LILAGSTLYGTAAYGGSPDNGTVFRVNTDGTDFTTLHSFTNNDGARPLGGLILSSNTLYGTALYGGNFLGGTVFAVNTDGTGFKVLHSFTGGSDGSSLYGGLILSGITLYGTTFTGGSSEGFGTVFAVNTDGTGFTNLHSFSGGFNTTNSEGGNPFAGLIVSSNTLYGTACYGGSSGNGTVFRVNTDGTAFTTLHSFAALSNETNSDGSNPHAGLILMGNTLYGTTEKGGSLSNGTVFAIQTDGTGFTTLHSFDVDNDGVASQGGLILSGNTLYGTATSGGSSGVGTVFAVNTDGTGFTRLHSFTSPSYVGRINDDGAYPQAGLVLSGNTLYGTAYYGGSTGNGTVFSLSFRPQLTITPAGTNVILTWPTNFAGFDYTGYRLQSTTNLASPLWTTNLPSPVALNGQKIVTNAISGKQQYYRLVQ